MSTFGTFKIFYCQNYKFTIHDFHWVAKYLFRCYCCFIYAQLLTLISDVDTASFPAKGKVVDSLELPAPSSIFLCAGGGGVGGGGEGGGGERWACALGRQSSAKDTRLIRSPPHWRQSGITWTRRDQSARSCRRVLAPLHQDRGKDWIKGNRAREPVMTTKPNGGDETCRLWIFVSFRRYSHAFLAVDYCVGPRGGRNG